MDERVGLIALLSPILMLIAGYLLAWRGKSPQFRKTGNLMVAGVAAIVALFSSWWALGMTYGLFFDSSREGEVFTIKEILLSIGAVAFILIFPIGAWYLCLRFAKLALRKD